MRDAERLGPRPVRDRPRDVRRRPLHDPAQAQRLTGIGRQLGLHADDPGARADRLDGGRDARREPTAADRHQDQGEVGQVLGDLQPARPLARDDPVVVVGRDHGQAALGGQPLRHGLALGAGVADRHDLGAVGEHAVALDRWGVLGHDDDRRDAEEPGSPGHPLGVVSRRVRDHAAGALSGVRARQPRCRRPGS